MMNKTLVLLVLLMLPACSGLSSTQSANPWVAEGKRQLSEGAWSPARASFAKAEELDPGNVEAEYGIVLCELRHFWAVLDLISGLSGDVLGAPNVRPELTGGMAMKFDSEGLQFQSLLSTLPVTGRGSLDDWLRQLVVDLNLTLEDLTRRTGRLRSNPNARINLTHFPFTIGEKLYMDFGGEWDRSDAYLLDALFSSASAFARTLGSQELAVGITPIYADYVSFGESFAPNVISAVLARNLDREPAWLTLKSATELEPDGATQWKMAGELWRRAADDLQLMALSIQSEKDDQTNDIFLLEPEKQKDFLLQQPVTDKKPARFLWEGATLSLKASVERISANLAEDGQPRVRLNEDLLLLGIVALDALRQSMDLTEFVGEFGIELPDIIGGFLSLPSSSGEGFATGILGVAGDYVPSGLIELDVGAFYRNPVDLRQLVPLWQVTPGEKHDGFLLSYECPRFEVTGAMQANGAVQISVLDAGGSVTPGAGNDTVTMSFATFGGGPTDAENIVFTEDPALEGWFETTILPAGAPVSLFDDILQLAGSPVTTKGTYVDTLAAPDVTLELRWVDGVRKDELPREDDLLCDAATRDGTHFAQAILEGATWLDIHSPRKGYPAIAADGIFGKLPYVPFGSPSFNGLLYLNPVALKGLAPLEDWDPVAFGFEDAMQVGDGRSFNALLQGYGALLGD